MQRMMRYAMVLAVSLGLSTGARAREVCDFLPVEWVNATFSAFAPWRVSSGGSGVCSFEADLRKGQSAGLSLVNFTVGQQFLDSAKEAAALVQLARTESVKQDLVVRRFANKDLGGEAYYSLLDQAGTRIWTGYTHAGKGAFNISLVTPQSPLSPEDEAAQFTQAARLVTQASAATGVAERAGLCPELDVALVKTVLAAKTVKVQQLGSGLCTAHNPSANANTVMFQGERAQDAQALQRLARAQQRKSCTVEPLPQLGALASLSYGCTEGNPSATVWFAKRLASYTFSVFSSTEPSAKQRQDLITLAKRSFDAAP